MRLPCVELEVSSCTGEKINHVSKTNGDKLFAYLLTNKIFSTKQILPWNFKMDLCLKRTLVWEFLK